MANSVNVTLNVTPQELRDSLTSVLRGVCLLETDSFEGVSEGGKVDLLFMLLDEVNKQCDQSLKAEAA